MLSQGKMATRLLRYFPVSFSLNSTWFRTLLTGKKAILEQTLLTKGNIIKEKIAFCVKRNRIFGFVTQYCEEMNIRKLTCFLS